MGIKKTVSRQDSKRILLARYSRGRDPLLQVLQCMPEDS